MITLICLVNLAFGQSESVDSTKHVVEEHMPLYPGGDQTLVNFVSSTLVYPPVAKAKGITGRTYIGYWVETDGSVGRIHVAQGSHPLLDEEALRVIGGIKGYTPGYQRGKAVPVRFTFPLRFTLDLPDNSPQSFYEESLSELKAGNEKQGRKLLDKAISLASDWYIEAYVKRAELNLELNDYSKAQKDFDKALEIDPARTDLWIGKAKCLYGRAKLGEAIDALEMAAKCNPYSSRALELMGDFNADNGNFSIAESAYDRAIEINSHNGELYYKRGNARARQNKQEEACGDWRQAVMLKFEDAKQLVEAKCAEKQ